MQPEMTAVGVHAVFDAQDRIRAERAPDLADRAWEVCPHGCEREYAAPCAGCLHAAAAERIASRNEL